MANDNKNAPRNTGATTDEQNAGKLSSNLPRPNILRIEVLDGESRERFLQTYGGGSNVYTSTNQLRKKTLNAIFTGNRAKENVFYGFLSPAADTSFNMTAKWGNSNIGGNAFDMVKKVVGATGAIGEVVNTALDIGTGINTIANQALELNSTATGAATMCDYTGAGLDNFTVSVVWYLPEQEKLATHSLRILYRMLYPRQISQDSVAKLIAETTTTVSNELIEKGKEAVDTAVKAIGNETLSKLIPPTPPTDANSNSPPSSIAEFMGEVAGAGSSVMTSINNFFGANTTINPMPVRVCIGQHIDVEPLVLTNVSTKFSRETFISETQGRHLPLFAYTTISFSYWLTPAPNHEFLNMLGTEIFGDVVQI